MVTIIANINGYETPINIPTEQLSLLSPLSVTGDMNDYTIDYGNGLVERGGLVTLTTSVEKDGYRETATTVRLPFVILDADATALNIVESVNTVYGENAFVRVNGNELGIYGSFIGTQHKQMQIKWRAKGYISNAQPVPREVEIEDEE